jgi:hypothetical protein
MTKLRRSGLWLPARVRELLLTRERPSKWDDMRELTAIDMMSRGTWKHQMHELLLDGQPVNIAGGLAGLEVNPQSANYATVTLTGTERRCGRRRRTVPSPRFRMRRRSTSWSASARRHRPVRRARSRSTRASTW